jgi:2-iminoacetate synthase
LKMKTDFFEILNQFNWEEVRNRIYSKTSGDVEIALSKKRPDHDDFMALVSPAASSFLEKMAQSSHRRTLKRFGNTIQLYIPLYLSNVCNNSCIYCGFNSKNQIQRKTLNEEEILNEVKVIKSLGFDHILLVTGEADHVAGLSYIQKAIRLVRPWFSHISLEVQPLKDTEYEVLIREGLNTVYIYQETYHQEAYTVCHPAGKKANFRYRLETPERLGMAGIYKTGLGVLLGLEDWRTDSFFLLMHLQYLERCFWKTKYSISFPRLRPFRGGFYPEKPVTDAELVQLICAYRLLNEEVELSLSTRESPGFRDHAMKLGITSMSAGSKTRPGGYCLEQESLEQFRVSDERSPQEVAELIRKQGYEPVWKDWDRTFNC